MMARSKGPRRSPISVNTGAKPESPTNTARRAGPTTAQPPHSDALRVKGARMLQCCAGVSTTLRRGEGCSQVPSATPCRQQAPRAPAAPRRMHLTLLPGCAASCHQSSSTTFFTPRRRNQGARPRGTYLRRRARRGSSGAHGAAGGGMTQAPAGRRQRPAGCFSRLNRLNRGQEGRAGAHQRRSSPKRACSCFTLPLSRWSALVGQVWRAVAGEGGQEWVGGRWRAISLQTPPARPTHRNGCGSAARRRCAAAAGRPR